MDSMSWNSVLQALKLREATRFRVRILRRSASHMPESFIPAAVAIARSISDEHQRFEALVGFGRHLKGDALVDLVASASKSKSDISRIVPLLVTKLRQDKNFADIASQLWFRAMRQNAESRDGLLRMAATLMPWFVGIWPSANFVQLFNTAVDVLEAWP